MGLLLHLKNPISGINNDGIIFSSGDVLHWNQTKRVIFLESAGGPVASVLFPSYTTKMVLLEDDKGQTYSPSNLRCIRRDYFLNEKLLIKIQAILKNASTHRIAVEIRLAEGGQQLFDIDQELSNISFALSPQGKQQSCCLFCNFISRCARNVNITRGCNPWCRGKLKNI